MITLEEETGFTDELDFATTELDLGVTDEDFGCAEELDFTTAELDLAVTEELDFATAELDLAVTEELDFTTTAELDFALTDELDFALTDELDLSFDELDFALIEELDLTTEEELNSPSGPIEVESSPQETKNPAIRMADMTRCFFMRKTPLLSYYLKYYHNLTIKGEAKSKNIFQTGIFTVNDLHVASLEVSFVAEMREEQSQHKVNHRLNGKQV